MFKKIGFALFGLLSWLSVQAAEVASAPPPALSDSIHLSGPQDLKTLSPELYDMMHGTRAQSRSGGAWWQDTATGPYPTMGGTWYAGGAMNAVYVPPGSVMQTVQYYWENGHLNGWNSQVTVWLYLTNGTTAYYADVTSQNSATLNASGIPANYNIFILMKVGNLVVSLYNPPYINYTSANVYYTY